MADSAALYSAVFLAGAIFTLLGVSMSRAAARLIRPAARILGRGGRAAKGASRGPRAASAGARRSGDHRTAIEWALSQPDDSGDPANPLSTYSFAEERRTLRKQGQVFKWLRIPGEFIPASLSEPFSDEIANEYLKDARRFFAQPVALGADAANFYEDEEGAVIVSMFRNSDRRAFYALDQLRRVINANALRLITSLSIALIAITGALWGATALLPPLASLSSTPLVATAAGAFLALTFYIFTAFSLQAFYANTQRQNMREFSDFLTRYLGLIANRFREASAKTSRVIQGDERDAKVLAANAQKWHKIMIWLGLRPFFIEGFVRNVNFQMRRNLNYYLIGAIGWLGIALPLFLYFALHYAGRAMGAAPTAGEGWIVAAAYAAFALFSLWQINRRVVFEELNQMNWLGFDNLEVGKQLDEVIGKYAEDIGLWKGRFDR
jgi:hypothetical protein